MLKEKNEKVMEIIPEKIGETIEKSIKKIKEKTEKFIEESVKKITKKEKKRKTDEIKKDIPIKKISKKELLEKAKKLAEKIEGRVETEEIKEKLEASRKTLVPIEDYIKVGAHIGTKVITPHMRKYVYRRRNDGIAILDINFTDEKLKELIKLVEKFEPENFILVCKREAGWKAVEKFSELTGVRVFTKKYPAGILTNITLPNFFETDMILVCDPWIDRNAMRDGKKIKKKIFALCDTNNYAFDADFFVPCNNKSSKSLGLILYIIAREYLKSKKIKKEVKLEDFVETE
ncbi:MAG: 30S ribosomal protein S2 [Nanoarchaeota archaeon]|nr:30S ribosomal protein S2 [Nanoarchaeota archaeon]